MKIIIRRATFNAEEFNSEIKCPEYALAENLNNFVAISVDDQFVDAFKEMLRAAHASLDAEYNARLFEVDKLAQVIRKQMMIRQIITKIFKPD